MSCVQCKRTVPLNKCPDTMAIGTIAPNTAVLGYIKKISNSATKFFSVTSDGDGLVSVDVSGFQSFLNTTKTEFEIWLTLASAMSFEDRLPFTIGEEEVDCVLVRFENTCLLQTDETETLGLETT